MSKFIELFTECGEKVWVKKSRIYRISEEKAIKTVLVGWRWKGDDIVATTHTNWDLLSLKEEQIFKEAYTKYEKAVEKLNVKKHELDRAEDEMYRGFTEEEKEMWKKLQISYTPKEECEQIKKEFPRLAELGRMKGQNWGKIGEKLEELELAVIDKCACFLWKARFQVFVHGASCGEYCELEKYYGPWVYAGCLSEEVAKLIESL